MGDDTHINKRVSLNSVDQRVLARENLFPKLPNLAQRQRIIQVKDGHILMHETTCNELLSLVHRNCNLDACNPKGILTYRDCKQLLSYTDIRPKIDTRFECIIVRLYPISALILRESVLVVANENLCFDDLLEQLSKVSGLYHGEAHGNTSDIPQDYETHLPFEITILQCCFAAAIMEAHRDLERLEQMYNTLEAITATNIRYKHVSMVLHELKQPANRLLETVSGYKEMMDEFLADSQEVHLLEFTNHPAIYGKHAATITPGAGALVAHSPITVSHATGSLSNRPNVDVEILLEYVDQEIEQVSSGLTFNINLAIQSCTSSRHSAGAFGTSYWYGAGNYQKRIDAI
ncbi:Magnesium transporter MRS2-like [Babesia duncani]|uniref:Magnesium transporter MRS2-like n=1 Tax=Babesia duncani TaxID=323732 RepID=A0AAD9PKN4_9APIC|nr:Magnesium transporter MRS2-like [Babesia duncani]